MADIKYYGLESHFNESVTFYKDVNINGNLNYDSLTVRNLTVKEQSNLAITTTTSLSAQNLNVSGITTVGFITAQNLNVSGIATVAQFAGVGAGTSIQIVSGSKLVGLTTGSIIYPGSVLQVVSTTKQDIWSGGAYPNWGTVTGLSVSITPTSSSSKILILGQVSCSSGYWEVKGRLIRNGNTISGAMGTPRGNRTVATFVVNEYPGTVAGYAMYNAHINYLDSPATTNSVTYGVQMRSYNPSYSIGVNYNVYTDEDMDTYYGNGISTLTAIEVSV